MKKKKARKHDGFFLDFLFEVGGELFLLLFRCVHKLFI
ncbi:hypothetical protein L606_000200004140 [Bacillus subtilis J25]|nr:hypothetical protein L608_000300005840 [Bacillus subtilis J23]TWG69848.1 hypothetical protein L606_000200004140 [Bacillus subtilis J25]